MKSTLTSVTLLPCTILITQKTYAGIILLPLAPRENI